ncbi:MAG: hypothetical protein V7L06_15020 [Nostoc sp.]
MKSEVANRRIQSFNTYFGEAHLHFACHAAFPVALTPDLLYRLWANFQYNNHGEVLNIPWIAVADLLLSSLCNEVGHELYEIDMAVRKLLLEKLRENETFGKERINDLSNFLISYIQPQLHSDDPEIKDLAQAQYLTALAYSRPSEAAHELALDFSIIDHKDTAELLRLSSLVETVAEPLNEFTTLLIYSQGMVNFARGKLEDATVLFVELVKQKPEVKVRGIRLPIPENIKANLSTVPKKFPTFSMIITILSIVITLAGAITAVVTIPEIGCIVSWNSSKCVGLRTESQKELELIVLNEIKEPLAGVEVEIIGNGPPEVYYTDSNGFIKVKIASRENVRIRFITKGYAVTEYTVNLQTSPNSPKVIRLVRTSPDSPIVAVDGNVTWQLESCKREQNNVSCIFSITSNVAQDYFFILDNLTKMVDSEGNEYLSSKIKIGKISVGSGNNLSLALVKNVQYKVTIDFTEVPTSIYQVALLQIQTINGQLIKYRQVPITN